MEKNEDDLNKNQIFPQFLLNLEANLSWVWLSSLRFLYSILSDWISAIDTEIKKLLTSFLGVWLNQALWIIKYITALVSQGRL